jgi:uracil-DNA glycosylase family 4
LYDLPALAAVERAAPMEVDPSCRLCPLGEREGLKHPCVPPAGIDTGRPGPTLLVVGEGPGVEEDRAGKPFVGKSGAYLRGLLQRHWPAGRIVLDNGTRCLPPRDGKDKLLPQATEACRGYLRATIDEVRPDRVLLVGAWAARSVLGRQLSPLSVRGGYGWLWNDGDPVPCFLVMHPAAALRNRVVARWFEADLVEALTRDVPDHPPWRGEARVVQSALDAGAAARELARARWVALDCETFGRFHDPCFRVLSVSLCAAGSSSPWVWPLAALEDPACVAALQRVLDAVDNVAMNGKYDAQALKAAFDVDLPAHVIDVRLARKIADPDAAADLETQSELVGMGGHKEENAAALKDAKAVLVAWSSGKEGDTVDGLMAEAWVRRAEQRQTDDRRLLREEGKPVPRLRRAEVAPARWYVARPEWWTPEVRASIGEWAGEKFVKHLRSEVYAYALVPEQVALRYVALDALSTARLGALAERVMGRDPRVALVWRETVGPASDTLRRVEWNGIAVNAEAIGAFGAFLALRMSDARTALGKYSSPDDKSFWADSPARVGDLLFKQLGLPVVSLTDTDQPSTDKSALESLRGRHPVVESLLEWRRLTKLKGTYADGMRRHIQADGRIHPSFLVDGARSGRLSSADPNAQNGPRAGTPEGKMFRDCFAAPPGHVLVEGDLSQAELRVAAMLSGDDVMRDVLASGADVHLETARFIAPTVWGIKPDAVLDEHRSNTKAVVFGLLYGKTDAGLAAQLGCTRQEAAAVREAVLGRYRRLGVWLSEQIREAHRAGGVYTWWAGNPRYRWRPLPDLGSQEDWRRAHGENAAVNTPIQGTANEFCLASLVALDSWLGGSGFPARIVLTVHDSILCECLAGREAVLIDRMDRIMTGWPSMGVPIKVDFKVGDAWGSLEKWSPASKKAAAGQR